MGVRFKPLWSLPWNQYFIDTSCNVHGTDTVRNKVVYKTVIYNGNHRGDYCILYDKERNAIQVHFEKTSGKQDWRDNFNFPKKVYDTFEWEGKKITLYTHSGWGDMYKAMKHDIHVEFEELFREHPTAGIESIGWSLGSAPAQMFVQDVNWRYGLHADCITFGSVKPFFYTDKKTKEYLGQCASRVKNFCHKSDIVTYQPPFPGYHMLKRVEIGKFNPVNITNPQRYHTLYNENVWYSDIPVWD